MWDLHPAQLLLALALDFVIGKPPWMPRLAQVSHYLTRRLSRTSESGEPPPRAVSLPIGILVPVLILLTYAALTLVLPPTPLAILEVFILYQAIHSGEITRAVKEILRHLDEGDVASASARTGELSGDSIPLAITSPEPLCERLIFEIGESISRRVVAPLFWGALLGAPGALLYLLLTGQKTPSKPSPERSTSPNPISIVDWMPSRLVALLSETFRNYRSFGKVRREAERAPGINRGWGAAAIARDLNVELGDTLASPEDSPPQPFHPGGSTPSVSHLAEALSWHWKITAFATVLALLATF